MSQSINFRLLCIKALQKQRKQEILQNAKADGSNRTFSPLEKRLLDQEVERRLAVALKKHSSTNQTQKEESEPEQNNEPTKE